MSHPKAILPLKVEPIEGERWCFMVQSRSTKDPWRVELDTYDWNGACACPDFMFRMNKRMEDGAVPSEATQCGHIKAAMRYAYFNLMPKLDAYLSDPKNSEDAGIIKMIERMTDEAMLSAIYRAAFKRINELEQKA